MRGPRRTFAQFVEEAFDCAFDRDSCRRRSLGNGNRSRGFAVPVSCFLPIGGDNLGLRPVGAAGVFSSILSVKCAGGEDVAAAFLPALLAFLKFAGAFIQRMSCFAFALMAPVEIERHDAGDSRARLP